MTTYGSRRPGESETLHTKDEYGNPIAVPNNTPRPHPYGDPESDFLSGRYQDSYGRLMQGIGKRDGAQTLEDLLANFKGSGGDLQRFMESPMYRGVMAYSSKGSDAYKRLAMMGDSMKQQASVGLGQISQAGARGIGDALMALNSTGLGRNVGMGSAIRQQGAMDVGARSALYGQSVLSQEMDYLSNMVDLEQQMAQLALGFSPQPRQPKGGSGIGNWIALAGTLIGSAFGAPWLGAAAGATAGAAVGTPAVPGSVTRPASS